MADKKVESSVEKFVLNDKTDYYSGIESIIVNGKNAYELKGKFLDDLHNNAFSETNKKDAVGHIEYYLKIVDPIRLPNVNQDKLRIVIFPISWTGGARRWKGALLDYWKMGSDEIDVSDDETSNIDDEIAKVFRIDTDIFNYETPICSAFNEFNYLLKVDPDLLTKDIEGFKTFDDYKNDWIYEWNKDKDDDYNGGNLPGTYIIRNQLHYQDYEWYEALEDSELKDLALRNKASMDGLISDDDNESCYKQRLRWEVYTNYDDAYEINHEEEESCEDHEPPACNIRKFMMIKYSFNDDEEYVAIKEDEYDDLAITRKEACQAYQEIFRMMDEGWTVTRAE
ncbi:hypothetical protein Tco_0569544 [Tanacetum coccineum]